VKRLGWREVEVVDLGELGELDLLLAEFASDEHEKPLGAAERSAAVVRLVEAAEREAEAERITAARSGRNSRKRGRPSEPGSTRSVAERLGLARSTIDRAVAHTDALKRYADLAPLSQAAALDEAARRDGKRKSDEEFERAAEERRAQAVARYPELDQPGVPRPRIVTAAGLLDDLAPKVKERVRAMLASGALPVDRVREEVASLTAIGTKKRLPPAPAPITDAEAEAIVVATRHQSRRAERHSELVALLLRLTEELGAAVTIAASVPDDETQEAMDALERAVALLLEVKGVLSQRL
jgi:hypothetical protein